MPIKTLNYAPEAFKYLNGIFCVYKPSGVPSMAVRGTLNYNLCRDLNELKQREMIGLVSLKGSACLNKPYQVEVLPNYADHPLVSGPRYQTQDIRMAYIQRLGRNTSGVFLMAVNDGCRYVKQETYRYLLRRYEVKGTFGISTKTFMSDGIVVERTSYKHIKESVLDRVLTQIQASHQSLAFKYSGVDIQSQEAYELASTGLVKPCHMTNPLIYSIKCTEFKLPHFTLEIHCINETEEFLAELVYDIGIDLRSSASCSGLQQTHFGPFRLPHALLRKHWTLENILSNITLCQALLPAAQSTGTQVKALRLEDRVLEEMQDAAREEEL